MNPALLLGLGQTLFGSFLPKGKRPSWEIPGAAQEALSMARTNAMATTRPGAAAAKEVIRSSADQTLNNVKRNAGSGQEVLASAIALNNNTNKALIQDNMANDNFRYNAQRNLQDTLNKFSAFQREKFVEDTVKPYQERVQAKNMLVGSGLQNMFGAFANMGQQKAQQQYLDYLTGANGQAGSTPIPAGVPSGGFNFGYNWGPWVKPFEP